MFRNQNKLLNKLKNSLTKGDTHKVSTHLESLRKKNPKILNNNSLKWSCDCHREEVSLMHFVAAECRPVMLVLLADRCDKSAINGPATYKQVTPLMYAVIHDKSDAIQALHIQKCDLNAQDYDGNTAFHHACMQGYQDCVQALLAIGVDVNVKNKFKKTGLECARFYGHEAIVSSIENRMPLNVGDDSTTIMTPLTLAKVSPVSKERSNKNLHYFTFTGSEPNLGIPLRNEFVESQTWKKKRYFKSRQTHSLESMSLIVQDEWEYSTGSINSPLNTSMEYSDIDQLKNQEYTEIKTAHEPTMLSELKKVLYNDEDVCQFVQEVYEDSDTVFVSVDHGKIPVVKKFVNTKFGSHQINYIEQEDFDSAIYLTGGKFKDKPCVGPGSCIVPVADRFVNDLVITGKAGDLTIPDILTGGNHFKTRNKSSLAQAYQGASEATVTEATYGTLACLAQVHRGNSADVYGLTVKHILEANNDDPIVKANVHVVASIKGTASVDASVEGIMKESLDVNFQDTYCLCDSIIGTESNREQKQIDVALLGPLHADIWNTHKPFAAQADHKIHIYEESGDSYVGQHVKKFGAATGLTIGKVLSYINNRGLFVIISKTDKFAEQGDSGAMVLLNSTDPDQGIIGLGLVHKMTPAFRKGTQVYRDAILCVRLDYCVDALCKLIELNGHDQIKLYFGHLTPDHLTSLRKPYT